MAMAIVIIQQHYKSKIDMQQIDYVQAIFKDANVYL